MNLLCEIEWLPEEVDENGEGRPFRPDLPWLRNLSWTKVHAMQLGFFLALVIYLGFMIGKETMTFAFILTMVSYTLGWRRVKNPKSSCEHNIGFHDVREKPWYFGSSQLATYICLYVVV